MRLLINLGCPVQIDYFEKHWLNNDSVIPFAKKQSAIRFLDAIIKPAFENPLILDAGCGDGVHLSVLNELLGTVRAVGVDISHNVIAKLKEQTREAVLCQADICQLPFGNGTFDTTYSFGVLAYTENPWQGMSELYRVTKNGGWVGVWLAPRQTGLLWTLYALVRGLTIKLPQFWQNRIADCLVPFLGFMPTTSGCRLGNSTWRQCREVVLVNIAPKQLSFPSVKEIKKHITALGVKDIFHVEGLPGGFWFIKESGCDC
jgi:SAM-dependent methyltransferase